ncbi:MAG: choice-of-anchor B family protein [Ignavibacteria bacterium]|nr:choice-of-anchor B family protein [Ignavibacteria bacterium]
MSKTSIFNFILALFLVVFSNNVFSQLGNNNMVLIANRNQHNPTNHEWRYSALWGYVAPNGREYAILGGYWSTIIYDVTDSANVYRVDTIGGVASGWREMKTFSHYAYVVSEGTNSRLQIINLQNLPSSVSLVATYSHSGYTRTHTVSQSGPYLYMNGGDYLNDGIFILDLTVNPASPILRGTWQTHYVHDCRVVNDTIYACNIYDPPGTVSVINAVNKNSLTTVTSWVNNPNPFPHNCALTTDRRYIYTTDETTSPPGKLKIWDITNIMSPVLVTTWQPMGITNTIVHNVEIYGNYALIAHYEAGVRLLNISNPTNPVEVAWYDTYPTSNTNQFRGCWAVYMFPSGKIIASDMKTGLYVLKTTFPIVGIEDPSKIPSNYSLNQNYPNPFNPVTTIEFTIPEGSHTKLTVYDVTGRQVGLLTDDYRPAGTYKINYDASHLASGVYFYTLSSGKFRQTRKMVITK